MISSMTGYAAATRELPIASLAAEVKSVNSRYLDVQFRLPDELRPVEPALRELIQNRVGRGKVECRVSVTPPASAAPRISVNEGLLDEQPLVHDDARRGACGRGARDPAFHLAPSHAVLDQLPQRRLDRAQLVG